MSVESHVLLANWQFPIYIDTRNTIIWDILRHHGLPSSIVKDVSSIDPLKMAWTFRASVKGKTPLLWLDIELLMAFKKSEVFNRKRDGNYDVLTVLSLPMTPEAESAPYRPAK